MTFDAILSRNAVHGLWCAFPTVNYIQCCFVYFELPNVEVSLRSYATACLEPHVSLPFAQNLSLDPVLVYWDTAYIFKMYKNVHMCLGNIHFNIFARITSKCPAVLKTDYNLYAPVIYLSSHSRDP
jgi:hypothetical protein